MYVSLFALNDQNKRLITFLLLYFKGEIVDSIKILNPPCTLFARGPLLMFIFICLLLKLQ